MWKAENNKNKKILFANSYLNVLFWGGGGVTLTCEWFELSRNVVIRDKKQKDSLAWDRVGTLW